MELIIKPFKALPCHLEEFTINGQVAEQSDFGDVWDHDSENAEPYACNDMKFEPKLPTSEVLNHYNITVDDYYTICRELESELHVGFCGWCV